MKINLKKKTFIMILSGVVSVVTMLTLLLTLKGAYLLNNEIVDVVAASKEIKAGQIISEKEITILKIPKQFVQPESLTGVQDCLGKSAVINIKEGEYITANKIIPLGKGSGISGKIQKNKRAVSISLDESISMAGLVKPGDRIDLLATFDFGNDTEARNYTFTILTNILVLSVDDDLGAKSRSDFLKNEKTGMFDRFSLKGGSKKVIGLELTPSEVQKVVLAQETASLAIALRPIEEKSSETSISPETLSDLTGIRELLRPKNRQSFREYKGR